MAQIDDTGTGHEARYESPAFDPRSAFAWTLRSGEIARREQRRELGVLPSGDQTPTATGDTAPRIDDTGTDTCTTPRYKTPTFDPRSAFARTLRAGEVARSEGVQRSPDSSRPRPVNRAAPLTGVWRVRREGQAQRARAS